MGTISEKLTYLNGTKQLLKDKINNLGGSIDDNTTFRQYANQLQNIYDNLPKTEYQEGTEVNLGKTIKGKLDYDNGVVGIGQSEQKTTTGRNKLENTLATQTTNKVTFSVNSDKTVTCNGTATATTYRTLNNIVLPAGNYILNGCPSGGGGSTYRLFAYNVTTSSNIGNDGGSGVAFTSNGTDTLRFQIIIYNGYACNNVVFKPMIRLSSVTDDTYEPYTGGQASPNPSYPQEIKSVTGNQDVVVSGKNLLDESTLLQGAWNGTTTKRVYFYANNYLNAGTYTIMTDLNTTDFRYAVNIASNQFPLGSGMSIDVYDSSWITTSYKTFTLSQGGYLGVGVKRANEGDIVPSDISSYHFMIYEGEYDSSISYEPYITPTSYQLSLGDNKFYGIGNYKDELIYDVDEDKVYKNSKIWKKNITDSSAWEDYSAYWGACSFGITKTIFEKQPIAWSDMYSKYFRAYTTAQTKNLENEIVIGSTTLIVNNKETATLLAFRNWLASNPFYIYYPLATPVKIPITDTNLHNQVKALYNAHSLNGTTIITSNGNLPMIIKVRGLKGE